MFPPVACRSHVERGTKFAQRAGELSTEALWRRVDLWICLRSDRDRVVAPDQLHQETLHPHDHQVDAYEDARRETVA